MGNTSSSPTSPLKRQPSLISRPHVLSGRLLRSKGSQHTHPLGPEYIISPYTEQSSPTNDSPTASQPSISNVSKRRPVDSSIPTHAIEHRRSLTIAASRLASSAVEVRRARSANATGVNKAERLSEFLGAPPPYSRADSPSSSLQGSQAYVNGGYLDVPTDSHREKGHSRRSASAEAPSHRRSPSTETDETEYELVPEEYGYGVGSGMRQESRLSSDRMRRLPPIPVEPISTDLHEITSSPTSSWAPAQREDPLELLKQYKTIFIIDDSASMVGERWIETREALASLADIAARYGADGFDAYFLNANRSAQNMHSAASVKRQFDSVEPQGISLLARRLEELLNDYIAELEQAQREVRRGDLNALRRIRPVNYIIITDGVPTDDPESVIIQAARRLDRGNLPIAQIGIQFVQVGDDPRATEALRELDDEIAKEYGVRDMVDTTPYTGGPLDSESLIKILLGGINRRVDKKGARSVM